MLPGSNESLPNRMRPAYYLLLCMHARTHKHTHTNNNRMVHVVLCFLSVLPSIPSLRTVHWSANIRPSVSDTNVFKMYYWPLKYCLVRRSSKTPVCQVCCKYIQWHTQTYNTSAMSEGLRPKINFFIEDIPLCCLVCFCLNTAPVH